MNARRLITVLGLLVLVAGCGDNNPLGRQAVKGTVTFDGEPLVHGVIEFASSDGGPVSSGAMIRQGKFTIAESKGLPAGKYKARIFSPSSSGSPISPEEAIERGNSLEPGIERIPARYNTATELTVDVRASGENRFDFALESAKP